MSATELARWLPLSVSATTDRLKRLTDSGQIRRFTLELEPDIVGRPLRVYVDARLRSGVVKSDADAALTTLPAVVNACHVTGRYDYELQIAAVDIADLDRTLEDLVDVVGAEETDTRLVLKTVEGFPRNPVIAEPTKERQISIGVSAPRKNTRNPSRR